MIERDRAGRHRSRPGRLRLGRRPARRPEADRGRAGRVPAGREIAAALVRPVRREVESFRFSTVRLDVRENTTKLNAALGDLWRAGGRDRRSARARTPRRGAAWLAAELARPLPPAAPRRPTLPAESAETLRHVPAGAAAARGDRPRGVRRVRAQHDAERERRARRLPAGQDRRPVRRHRRASRAAPCRSSRCSRPSTTCSARPAIMRELLAVPLVRAQRPGAGRGAGGDDRLLGLEQGRRLPHLELGAVQGADQADAAGQGDAACRSRSSTGAEAR